MAINQLLMKAGVSQGGWRVVLLNFRGARFANAIKVQATCPDLDGSGQKLLRQGVNAGEVSVRLGIRAGSWQEICGAAVCEWWRWGQSSLKLHDG